MKTINIENSEIYYSIVLHLEIPSKYSYMGEGAYYWSKLSKRWSKSGLNASQQATLLKSSMDHIIGDMRTAHPNKSVHVIDLGCGDGSPAVTVCEKLLQEDMLLRYTAADISPQMIDTALNKLKKSFGNELICNSFTLDFETQSPAQVVKELCSGQHINLFLFLGNTLGNYHNTHNLLQSIANAMNKTDYLVVGNGLVPKNGAGDLIRAYDNVDERRLLSSTAKRLGISLDDIRFIWSAENEIQALARLEQDIQFKHHAQKALLKSGTELLLLRSKKYKPYTLASLLGAAGLKIIQQWINPLQTNMLLVGVKKDTEIR